MNSPHATLVLSLPQLWYLFFHKVALQNMAVKSVTEEVSQSWMAWSNGPAL